MGGQHRKIDKFIKKELSNGDKFGWELETAVLKEKNPGNDVDKTREIKKSFYYALNKLLESEELEIVGYEKRGVVKQSFSAHSFLFKLSERLTYLQVKNLLNNLDSDEKALSQLTNVFKKKFQLFEKQEIEFYKQIAAKATSVSLGECIKSDEKLLEKLISEYDGDPGYDPTISKLKSAVELYRRYTKYPNSRMWQIKGLTEGEYNTILKLNGKQKLSPREAAGKLVLGLPWLDTYGNISKKQFLEEKGLFKQETKSLDEIRSLFNEVLFFINSHENYKFMQHSFARALSDEKDSMDWFKIIINNLISPIEKLIEELGSKTYEEDLMEQLGRDRFGRKITKNNP